MNRKFMYGLPRVAVKWLERLDFITKPAFYCNVCGRPARHPFDGPKHNSDVIKRLSVVGGGFRKREQCAWCLSNDRLRFTVEVLNKHTGIFTSECAVLEFAPIDCLSELLKRNSRLSYLSGDIVPGRAMRVIDITQIDLPDAAFDYVICNHVLEHIEREDRAVLEMLRVLKPGGRMLISMPIALALDHTLETGGADTPDKRLKAYGQRDHVRLYGRDVKARLEKYGLDVIEIIARDDMPGSVARYGLIPEDRNYLCARK